MAAASVPVFVPWVPWWRKKLMSNFEMKAGRADPNSNTAGDKPRIAK
jgi:hypothetical protein